MNSEVKDTIEIVVANGTAIGISLSNVNEILTLISLFFAIGISIYKIYYWNFKKK
tara:strand:+ start:303 stop:467 length:165 start_codon:yes stop_codon:yes gene_type:complete